MGSLDADNTSHRVIIPSSLPTANRFGLEGLHWTTVAGECVSILLHTNYGDLITEADLTLSSVSGGALHTQTDPSKHEDAKIKGSCY